MVRKDGSCLDRGQTFFGDLVSLAFLYLVVKIGTALMNAVIIGQLLSVASCIVAGLAVLALSLAETGVELLLPMDTLVP